MDYSLSDEPYKITQVQKMLPGSLNPLGLTLGISLFLHGLFVFIFMIQPSLSKSSPSKPYPSDVFVPVSVVNAKSAPAYGEDGDGVEEVEKGLVPPPPTANPPPVASPPPAAPSETFIPDELAEETAPKTAEASLDENLSLELKLDTTSQRDEERIALTQPSYEPNYESSYQPSYQPKNFGKWDISKSLVKSGTSGLQQGEPNSPISCYAAIRAQDLSRNQEARPCFRDPRIFPKKAKRSGYCEVLHDINTFGKVENVQVNFCSNEIFRSNTMAAAKTWYYFPKVNKGRPVKQQGYKVRFNYNLRNPYGEIISY